MYSCPHQSTEASLLKVTNAYHHSQSIFHMLPSCYQHLELFNTPFLKLSSPGAFFKSCLTAPIWTLSWARHRRAFPSSPVTSFCWNLRLQRSGRQSIIPYIASPIVTCSPISLSMPTAAAKSLQSCPTLCDPIDGSPPGSPVPGILQARTLEWVAFLMSDTELVLLLSQSVFPSEFLVTFNGSTNLQ